MSARMRRCAAAATVLALAAPAAWAGTANRIVAIVNEAVITEADLAAHVSDLADELEERLPDEPRDDGALRAAVLQRLIQQQLILQEGRRAGVTVPSAAVLKRLEELRERFDTEADFQHSLKTSGLSEERLKEQIREQLLIKAVIDGRIRSGISVSPQEVAREANKDPAQAQPGERVRAAHLLIRVTEERPEAAARALIEQLHRQAERGADFGALAAKHSEDPHRDEGGDMGWVAQGDLLPELDAALFSLSPGQVSDPIQTRLGFHLVKVLDRRTSTSLSLQEAHEAIYRRLYAEKFERAFQRWISELGRKAYIEIL